MRKAFWLVAAATVLLFPTAVLADSISPTSVTATLGVGDSVTVAKTVTVSAGTPTTSKVDVFFLADTTGSMYFPITSVIASAGSILSSTAGLGDVAFGVGEYKDFGDPYAYRLNTAMTTNQATAQAGINMWSASGGGDYQEAELYALNTLATSAATGWRTGSTKILVWFGDASGHDPSGGITEAVATASLVTGGIKVEAIDVGNMNSTGQASAIATATGGAYYFGIDSSSIVATITAAITSSFVNYTTVGLDLSEVPAGVIASSTPLSYLGAFDRSIERTFGFSLTFTGVTPGSYAFSVYGTVDGGRVATESDRITVTGAAVPEPGTLLLLGSGLIGLAGYRRRARKM